MTQYIESKNALFILGSALAVAFVEDLVVALSSTLPWITNRLYHAFFIGSIFLIFGLVIMISIHKRMNIQFQKHFILLILSVFVLGAFFDFFILDYIRSITFVIFTFQITGEVTLTFSIYTLVLFLYALSVFYLMRREAE